MSNDEFYIGWMQTAPASLSRFIGKYLVVVLIAVMVIATLLALKQKQFSTSNFEFGYTTTVRGVYHSSPVPHLLVSHDADATMIPLVGYGKHGANTVMMDLAKEHHTNLEGKDLSLKGTLLYGDGKILMQVDQHDQAIEGIHGPGPGAALNETAAQTVSLKGEIIDPKCYFGVMKPGEGKVHKDCAVRCIAGGIPPVLRLTNEKGENDYVLLVSSKGNIIEKVKDFVAAPSQINGRIHKYANWLVLDVDSIRQLSELPRRTAAAVCCGSSGCFKLSSSE